jgi:hypothetical protein
MANARLEEGMWSGVCIALLLIAIVEPLPFWHKLNYFSTIVEPLPFWHKLICFHFVKLLKKYLLFVPKF